MFLKFAEEAMQEFLSYQNDVYFNSTRGASHKIPLFEPLPQWFMTQLSSLQCSVLPLACLSLAFDMVSVSLFLKFMSLSPRALLGCPSLFSYFCRSSRSLLSFLLTYYPKILSIFLQYFHSFSEF